MLESKTLVRESAFEKSLMKHRRLQPLMDCYRTFAAVIAEPTVATLILHWQRHCNLRMRWSCSWALVLKQMALQLQWILWKSHSSVVYCTSPQISQIEASFHSYPDLGFSYVSARGASSFFFFHHSEYCSLQKTLCTAAEAVDSSRTFPVPPHVH